MKNIGDCVVAYFPEPNFIGMNDNAIDCATSIKLLIEKGINAVLKENKLPALKFRIGIDSGEAMVKIVGAKGSKRHKDLLGKTLNLATKIQKLAGSNEILMGETAAKNVHTNWREICERIKLPETWQHRKKESGTYQVYRLKSQAMDLQSSKLIYIEGLTTGRRVKRKN